MRTMARSAALASIAATALTFAAPAVSAEATGPTDPTMCVALIQLHNLTGGGDEFGIVQFHADGDVTVTTPVGDFLVYNCPPY